MTNWYDNYKELKLESKFQLYEFHHGEWIERELFPNKELMFDLIKREKACKEHLVMNPSRYKWEEIVE